MRRAKKTKVEAPKLLPEVEATTAEAGGEGPLVLAAAVAPALALSPPALPDALQQELDAALADVKEYQELAQWLMKEMRQSESKRDVMCLKYDAAMARLDRRMKAKDRKMQPSGYDILNTMLKWHEKKSAAEIACLQTQLEQCQMDWGAAKARTAARDVRIRMLSRDIRRLKKSCIRKPRARAEE